MRWFLLALTACQLDVGPPPHVDDGTFPYHPVVYELDLAILAYQLHAQTLIWPMDPFYEEHAGDRGTPRDTFMALVHGWANTMPGGNDRGPGVLDGLPDNPGHDPIISDYTRIHPQSHALTNNQQMWTEYLTPDAITHRIRDVYVAARTPAGDIAVTMVAPGRDDSDPDATDTLCAFEGGTGDKGITGQPPSWSLMGYALARDTGTGWDLHLAFRGSRSGSAFRAASEALSEAEAVGNPDWISDLGWDNIQPAEITQTGGVHRGFAHSMISILPGTYACLAQLAVRGAPEHIFVTGHSLGGGLAQMFASSVMLGAGPPDALAAWPWQQLKLVTFSAPRAGDYTWASALAHALDSTIYDPGPLDEVDADARVILDPGIARELLDSTHASAFRVSISTDPITTTKIGGDGTHVGETVYVNGTSFLDWIGIDSTDSHEPMNVRKDMLDQLADARIPPLAWRYRPVTDLAPTYDAANMGTPAEVQKLADGLAAYYQAQDIYFDAAQLARDVDLYFAIERGQAP